MRICDVISYSEPQPYEAILTEQHRLMQLRQESRIPDTLLLLEHPPTITMGRKSSQEDFLTTIETLRARGVTVVPVDRGGEITYHAPGQLVGYPILDLRNHGQDLHRYLRELEEVLLRALSDFGLEGAREPGRTGVWVDGRKIAAIGIKVSRWITMHGFALNITADLTPLRRDIVPCGIRDRDVTSLQELLPTAQFTRRDIEPNVLRRFVEVFHLTPILKSERV